jgi:hypothetical protein
MDEILRHTVRPIKSLISYCSAKSCETGKWGVRYPGWPHSGYAILNGATIFEIMNATEM